MAKKKQKFFEIGQNNSGGSFDTDKFLCHRLIIEADSAEEADKFAEDHLGVYFNGCSNGMDCSCCGDRWSGSDEIEISKKMKQVGYEVYVWREVGDYKKQWDERIRPMFPNLEPVEYDEESSFGDYTFKKYGCPLKIKTLEDYLGWLAVMHGDWTCPEIRIFYKDGTVKEIFGKKQPEKGYKPTKKWK